MSKLDNILELFSMLDQALEEMETEPLADQIATKLEINRFVKVSAEKFKVRLEEQLVAQSNGSHKWEIGNYKIQLQTRQMPKLDVAYLKKNLSRQEIIKFYKLVPKTKEEVETLALEFKLERPPFIYTPTKATLKIS